MGANISKRYSSYQSQPKVFKILPNFPPNGPHKTTFGIFESLSFRFLTFFFENIKFTIIAYGDIKTSIIWKTSARRAKRSESLDSRVVVQHIWGTFGLAVFKVIEVYFGFFVIWA